MANKTNENSTRLIDTISLQERESLLRTTAGFADLNVSELAKLVAMMKEVHVDKGETIVREGEIVDSFYIIARGSVEVTKEVIIDGKVGITFLAILNQGENIGLKEARLFTETGTRTATVKANEPTILLRINLKDFTQHLSDYPHLLQSLKDSAVMALRMQFIKESDPFMKLTNQHIVWLANSVKEISVKPGEILFQQGDIAHSCYMIAEGTVELVVKEKDGSEKVSATLTSGQLFGERTTLNAPKRNYTARALIDSRLLVLDEDILEELQAIEITSEMFSENIEDKHPVRLHNILHFQKTMTDGQVITTLKDSIHNRYLQLTEEGWFIWQQLNGRLTIQEITQLFTEKFGRIDPQEVIQLLQIMINAGFAHFDLLEGTAIPINSSIEQKESLLAHFQFEHFIKKPDKKMDSLFRYAGFLFFKIPVLLLIAIIILIGMITFPADFHLIIQSLPKVNHLYILLVCVIVIGMTFRLISPLAKAMTIKKYDYSIPHLSFGWHVIGPVLRVDSSDLWISPRGPRIAAMSASIAADLFMAGILSWYAWYNPGSSFAFFASLCALFIYLQVLHSFDPLLDLDGYQLVINILDVPKLRETTIKRLFHIPPRRIPKPISLKARRSILLFCLYCLVFIAFLFLAAAWVLKQLPPALLAYTWNGTLIYLLIAAGLLIEWIMEINYQKKVTQILSIME